MPEFWDSMRSTAGWGLGGAGIGAGVGAAAGAIHTAVTDDDAEFWDYAESIISGGAIGGGAGLLVGIGGHLATRPTEKSESPVNLEFSPKHVNWADREMLINRLQTGDFRQEGERAKELAENSMVERWDLRETEDSPAPRVVSARLAKDIDIAIKMARQDMDDAENAGRPRMILAIAPKDLPKNNEELVEQIIKVSLAGTGQLDITASEALSDPKFYPGKDRTAITAMGISAVLNSGTNATLHHFASRFAGVPGSAPVMSAVTIPGITLLQRFQGVKPEPGSFTERIHNTLYGESGAGWNGGSGLLNDKGVAPRSTGAVAAKGVMRDAEIAADRIERIDQLKAILKAHAPRELDMSGSAYRQYMKQLEVAKLVSLGQMGRNADAVVLANSDLKYFYTRGGGHFNYLDTGKVVKGMWTLGADAINKRAAKNWLAKYQGDAVPDPSLVTAFAAADDDPKARLQVLSFLEKNRATQRPPLKETYRQNAKFDVPNEALAKFRAGALSISDITRIMDAKNEGFTPPILRDAPLPDGVDPDSWEAVAFRLRTGFTNLGMVTLDDNVSQYEVFAWGKAGVGAGFTASTKLPDWYKLTTNVLHKKGLFVKTHRPLSWAYKSDVAAKALNASNTSLAQRVGGKLGSLRPLIRGIQVVNVAQAWAEYASEAIDDPFVWTTLLPEGRGLDAATHMTRRTIAAPFLHAVARAENMLGDLETDTKESRMQYLNKTLASLEGTYMMRDIFETVPATAFLLTGRGGLVEKDELRVAGNRFEARVDNERATIGLDGKPEYQGFTPQELRAMGHNRNTWARLTTKDKKALAFSYGWAQRKKSLDAWHEEFNRNPYLHLGEKDVTRSPAELISRAIFSPGATWTLAAEGYEQREMKNVAGLLLHLKAAEADMDPKKRQFQVGSQRDSFTGAVDFKDDPNPDGWTVDLYDIRKITPSIRKLLDYQAWKTVADPRHYTGKKAQLATAMFQTQGLPATVREEVMRRYEQIKQTPLELQLLKELSEMQLGRRYAVEQDTIKRIMAYDADQAKGWADVLAIAPIPEAQREYLRKHANQLYGTPAGDLAIGYARIAMWHQKDNKSGKLTPWQEKYVAQGISSALAPHEKFNRPWDRRPMYMQNREATYNKEIVRRTNHEWGVRNMRLFYHQKPTYVSDLPPEIERLLDDIRANPPSR